MKKIYLIKSYDTGYYKIGIAKNPDLRLKQLQTANHEKLEIIHTYETSNYSKLEVSLHNHYSYCHKINEWFTLNLEDEVKFIDICSKFDNAIKIILN